MRAGVLGSPVAHSLSPVLHRAAYAQLGLDWSYDAHDVPAGGLAGFLDALGPDWAGLSVTMPLKREALDLVDWASPGARDVEAVNTVLLSRGRRLGSNTDVPGMLAALAEAGTTSAASGTVLGGGATARSALGALRDLGVARATVVARRPAAVQELAPTARRLGLGLVPAPWDPAALGDALGADVVVAAVPGEAAAALAAAVPPRPGTLLDVAYDPWPTSLAAAWERAGGAVRGGLDLLVHQAVLQVGLMTGRDAPGRLLPVMRAAAEEALAARA
ncbi:shikimate dehydrogenase [Vallicoccus soli]|uniref:shikimate dehydrogenase n=1 Tax=Vallicoccus soli TaxID=2339232 RepID=UPI001C4999CC|nr:shikimate dehydrogenase [Vallicoccus soli]